LKMKKNDLQGSFEKLVAKPLGMKHTHFVWNTYVAEHQATGHVDGKVAEGYGINAKKPDFYASYSMQSEAISYSKFLIALIHDKGLKKERFDDMYTPQFPQSAKSTADFRGLGIVIRPTAFGDEYHHTGYNLNFTSAFLFNKKQKFGYVFFTNCNKGVDFNTNLEKFLHPE
jgi:CubicO group peptidase (beta-lactamase class C family)